MSSPADKPTILLIEDDASLGRAMEVFLTSIGYAPTLCRDGASALQMSATIDPDAVVTDIHLPDISGLVLSQKFREKFGPETPIIVLSGDTSTEVLKSLTHVGATYFFNKPVNLELLKNHLAETIGAKR